VRTIGLGVAPTDVEVGAGSVWVLSDWALLRVDPAINEVVATVRLPRGSGQQRYSHMEVGANAVFVCSCPPGPVIRIDPATTSVVSVSRSPVWMIAHGEGALWAITGYELDTIEGIDPRTNAIVATIPLERIGETHGFRYRMAVGAGAIWVLSPASLWRIDSATKRFLGSVRLGHSAQGSVATGDGAVWVANSDGILLRVDPNSQTVAKTIPLGTLIYPAVPWDALAVGEGSVWVAVTSSAS
jgi:streptogramin lyase